MANITVKNTAGLVAAAKAAKSGDIISLASGTYSDVQLVGIKIDGNVKIQSLDANKPAVLTFLKVENSKGLTFSNLEFFADPIKKVDAPFRIGSSSDIKLEKLFVHGSLNGSSHDDVRGMTVRLSDNVSIVDSRFENLTDALSHYDSRNLTFSGNNFSTIRDNGIAGGGSSHLTIENNYFTNFDHVGEIHPDAIQVWTTNTKQVATDITISGNVFNRGSGAAIQGIWMRDEVGNLPFERVTIADNTIVGASYQGIAIMGGGKDITVKSNKVVAVDGQLSWIMVRNTAAATVSGNIATEFQYFNSAVEKSGNVKITSATAAQAQTLTTWLSGNWKRDSLAEQFGSFITDRIAMLGFVDQPAPNVAAAASLRFTETVLTGAAGADRLTAGKVGDYRLEGGAGDDTLTGGGAGVTKMNGGLGNDTYVVRNASDQVAEMANAGIDTVVAHVDYVLGTNVENLRMAVNGLNARGNDLANSMVGSAGDDVITGEGGNDVIQGAAGRDELRGGAGDDSLIGENGDDVLHGDEGADKLYGGAGADVLHGGAGANLFEGGAGADKLYGGAGADSFFFRGTDLSGGVAASTDSVFGFSSAQRDKIALSMVDANSRTVADDAFKFIGGEAFHGRAGELRVERQGGDSYVYGDTNGDRVADFAIHLVGVTSISAGDFYL